MYNVFSTRQTTEALLRYHLYVDCMPVGGMEGMSGEEMERITRIASSSCHTAKSDRYSGSRGREGGRGTHNLASYLHFSIG